MIIYLFILSAFGGRCSAYEWLPNTEMTKNAKIISHTLKGCEIEISEQTCELLVAIPPTGNVKCEGGKIDKIVWIRNHRIARILPKTKNLKIKWSAPPKIAEFGVQSSECVFDRVLERQVINYKLAKDWVKANPKIKGDPFYGYKIITEEEGIYRITYEKLQKIIPQINTIDPKKIKIMYKGFEIPIIVKGEEDGKFDKEDWIEFYAERIGGERSYYNQWYDKNVYWLTYGEKDGSRLVVEKKLPGIANIPTYYKYKLHIEEDNIYKDMVDRTQTDFWFYDTLSTPKEYNIKIPAPVREKESELKIEVYTKKDTGECVIYLNNYLVGIIPKGNKRDSLKVTLPRNILKEDNELRIEPKDGMKLYFNYVEINYYRMYQTDGLIKFTPPATGIHKIKITGFRSPNIRVCKIGTSIIEGKIEFDTITNTYNFIFEDTFQLISNYIAQDFIKEPELFIEKSDLRSTNGAEYLIITDTSLKNSAEILKSWKNSLSCKIIYVDDIYNEFNYGIPCPKAIKTFLKYAFENWEITPVYVLLLGDASIDHRNILGHNEDLVPSYYIFDPWKGRIPADNAYACVSGEDAFPDMIITRLPIKNEKEFSIVFNKLQNFESIMFGEWRRTILFGIHDVEEPILKAMEKIMKTVPMEWEINKIYYPRSDAQPDLIKAIEKGAILINWFGHTGEREWAGGAFWREAIPRLTNVNKLPFILVLGCYNGKFDIPGEDLMSELFIKSHGGGIAYSGPTGAGTTADIGLIEGATSAICNNKINTVGELALESLLMALKRGSSDKALLQQVFMGDGSLKLFSPKKEITLKLIPPGIFPGDTAKLIGEVQLDQGEGIVTIYIKDTIGIRKERVKIENGRFELNITIPDTIRESSCKITVYAWSDTLDYIGVKEFSVSLPTISDVQIIPEKPTAKTGVKVRAKVFDPYGIRSVKCNWSVCPPPWDSREMEPDPLGYYITKTEIPPHVADQEIFYRIIVENINGEKYYSKIYKYKVLSIPDLILSEVFLDGIEYTELCAKIYNIGEIPADSFIVAFYSQDTILIGKDTISVGGRTAQIAKIKSVPPPEKVIISIDPENKIEETNEINNISLQKLKINLFNVTKEKGTDGWVCLDPNFFCSIESVSEPTVLEIKDTTAGYISRLRNKKSKLTGKTKIIMKQTPIYRWESDYKRWLFISSDTLADVKKLGYFSKREKIDSKPPEIKTTLQPKILTREVPLPLKIEIIINDESGIDIIEKGLIITINGEQVDYSYPTEEKSLCALPVIIRKTLPLGIHTLSITAWDFEGNKSEKKFTFEIELDFEIVNGNMWGNYPNPIRDGKTKFYFEFTTHPDKLNLRIYTISGRLIDEIILTPLDKKIIIEWDAKKYANGTYFYKIEAKKAHKKIEKILKLAILQ